MTTEQQRPLVELRGIGKRYPETVALDAADLDARPGEVVGLVGHNGAGKSTLMRVLAGLTAPDDGVIRIDGDDVTRGYDAARARRLGVRLVHQELSLCPNLRVYENLAVRHPELRGWGWRGRARELMQRSLGEVFPSHRIAVDAPVSELSLAEQQMVEIAGAVTVVDSPLRLLILDEPTSSLDRTASGQLFRFLRERCQAGLSCLLVTHRLAEIREQADRIQVMRDGRVVAGAPVAELSEDDLVQLMGGSAPLANGEQARATAASAEPCIEVRDFEGEGLHGVSLRVRPGEIVALGGLEGQGQRDLLRALYRHRRRSGDGLRIRAHVAYVSGDRGSEGVFPLWSVGRNVTVGGLGALLRWGLISGRRERELARQWAERLEVRGGLDSSITDLSGGNQQKVLMARALASHADVILFDDPLRGVDMGTKRQLYQHIRAEAGAGRTFLWYSTENDELQECDRALIMREGRIVAELGHDEMDDDHLVAASFRQPAGVEAGR